MSLSDLRRTRIFFIVKNCENMFLYMIIIRYFLCDLEESASHPLPLLEGAPQILTWIPMVFNALSDGTFEFFVRSRDTMKYQTNFQTS